MVALPPDYDNGEARGKWNGGGLKLEDPSQPHKPLSPIVCTSYISNGSQYRAFPTISITQPPTQL